MHRKAVFLITAVAAFGALTPVTASAQDTDVVVMRRVVGQSNYSTHGWRLGDWVPNELGCSSDAPAHRTVECVDANGTAADDANCRGPKPTTAGTAPTYATCVVDWNAGAFGDYVEGCSDLTYRERAVSCSLFTSAARTETIGDAPGGGCNAATRPSDRSTPQVANYSTCSFQWKARPSQCDGAGYRDTVHECVRSGGSSTTVAVTDTTSVQRCGIRPADLHVADNACGPRNLMENPSFENGSGAPWQAMGGSTYQIIPDGHTGTKSLYVGYTAEYQLGRLPAGAYELSVWVKADGREGYNPGSCYNYPMQVNVYQNGFGVGEYRGACPADWTKITIPFRVGGGAVWINIQPQGRKIAFDDFSVIRTGD